MAFRNEEDVETRGLRGAGRDGKCWNPLRSEDPSGAKGGIGSIYGGKIWAEKFRRLF